MSNIFKEVLNNPQGVEEKLLGPSYPYYKNIKTPSEIGMSDKGSIQQMGKNISGLIEYVSLLVSGDSKASATGRPLGNKFFLQTGGKCAAIDSCSDKNDISTCQQVDRYIYVDNVPEGNIPLISGAMGVNFKEFRGLIPGAMGNLNVLNPFAIMRSFLSGATPACQPITMEVINNQNIKSSESHYVTLADITGIDPCIFPNKINPINNNKCKQTFQNMNNINNDNYEEVKLPEDDIAQLYFASLAILGIYILYGIMKKSK